MSRNNPIAGFIDFKTLLLLVLIFVFLLLGQYFDQELMGVQK